MAGELLQDAVVTVVALGASIVVARRLIGVVATKSNKAGGCDHCTTTPTAGRRAGPAGAGKAGEGVYPLSVIRPSRR